MAQYFNEVAALSLSQARAIRKMMDDLLAKAQKLAELCRFCSEMIESFAGLGQAAAGRSYARQLDEARRSLAEVYTWIGHAWTYYGDNDKSCDAYRRAADLDPEAADPVIFIGRSLLEAGSYAPAAEVLERAVKLSPYDSVANFYLAEAYFELRDIERAEQHYLRASQSPYRPGQPLDPKLIGRWKRFSRYGTLGSGMLLDWRRAVRTDASVERDFARLKRLAGDRPIYITHLRGRGWVLSHMVHQIEVFVRELALEGVDNPFIVVLNPNAFCNDALVAMYGRVVWMVDDRYPRLRRRLTNVREWLAMQGSPIAAPIDAQNPRPHVAEIFRNHLRCWTDAPQTIRLTDAEEKKGLALKASLGMKADDPFVCFGIRESGYYQYATTGQREYRHYWQATLGEEVFQREELGSIPEIEPSEVGGAVDRNNPLQTALSDYLPMAQALADQGLHVLRMGTLIDSGIPESLGPKVIDYASRHRSDFGDVYLFAKCKFVVAGGTGAHWISAAFGRPVVNTDMYLPNSTFFNTSRDGVPSLSLPRKLWYKPEKRFLTYSEVFQVFRRYQSQAHCERDGIENIGNSAEEIEAVCLEMNARIDGTWTDGPEDDELQQRFRALHQSRDTSYACNGRIGAQFLRDHVDLIR